MTPEKFHDALTLLPADLVAEADKKRSGKAKHIHWKSYAAAAACLSLILLGGWFTYFRALPGMNKKAAPEETAMLKGSRNTRYDSALPETVAAAGEAAPMEQGNLHTVPTTPVRTESAVEDAPAANTSEDAEAAFKELHPDIALLQSLDTTPPASACYSSTPSPVVFHSRAELEEYKANSLRLQQPVLADACSKYEESWFENRDLVLVTVCGIPAGEIPEIRDIRHYENQWKFVIQADTAPSEEALRDWHFLLSAKKALIHPEETLICSIAISGDSLCYQQSFTPHPGSDIPCADAPEELLVTSRSQLDRYFTDYTNFFDFAQMEEVCGDYDDAWFETHDLLLILIEASHPDNRWQIVDITNGRRWDWEVLVQVSGEFYPGQEAYALHLLVELEKGILLPENSIKRITNVPPGE